MDINPFIIGPESAFSVKGLLESIMLALTSSLECNPRPFPRSLEPYEAQVPQKQVIFEQVADYFPKNYQEYFTIPQFYKGVVLVPSLFRARGNTTSQFSYSTISPDVGALNPNGSVYSTVPQRVCSPSQPKARSTLRRHENNPEYLLHSSPVPKTDNL